MFGMNRGDSKGKDATEFDVASAPRIAMPASGYDQRRIFRPDT
jgi:hypothetical protein